MPSRLIRVGDADGRGAAIASSLVRRVAQPAEMADVVVFLASHQARYVTAQVLGTH